MKFWKFQNNNFEREIFQKDMNIRIKKLQYKIEPKLNFVEIMKLYMKSWRDFFKIFYIFHKLHDYKLWIILWIILNILY